MLTADFGAGVGAEKASNLALPLSSAGPQGGLCLFLVIDWQAPRVSTLITVGIECIDFVDAGFCTGDRSGQIGVERICREVGCCRNHSVRRETAIFSSEIA